MLFSCIISLQTLLINSCCVNACTHTPDRSLPHAFTHFPSGKCMYLVSLLTITCTALFSRVCVILIQSIVNLLALRYSSPFPPALIPAVSSTAPVSVFFRRRPGHVGEQALPGAIHIPQVSLSLWMMFLPNYLDPEPQHQPCHTHIHAHSTHSKFPLQSSVAFPLCFTVLQTPLTQILILPDHFSVHVSALHPSSSLLLSLFRGRESVKVCVTEGGRSSRGWAQIFIICMPLLFSVPWRGQVERSYIGLRSVGC